MRALEIWFACMCIAACAPSQASIATAIAATQSAVPTSTSTASATSTATATVTPPATATSTPTATLAPTATARAPLFEVALTRKDIDDVLSGFYLTEPLDLSRNLGDTGLDRIGLLFQGARSAGNVTLVLVLLESPKAARDANLRVVVSNANDGPVVDMPMPLTSDAVAINRTDKNDVVLMFSSGDVTVYLGVDIGRGLTANDIATFVALVGGKQLTRLERAGYK